MKMRETAAVDRCMDEFRIGRLLGKGAWLEEVGTGDTPLPWGGYIFSAMSFCYMPNSNGVSERSEPRSQGNCAPL